MKREAQGTQQPRHINQIDEEASTAQRSDSPVQSINQPFPKSKFNPTSKNINVNHVDIRNIA
ncbi:hypothetical protein [Nitrosomonas sp. Nm166]|uniref:hypothetical protein n=1 Tax=Nitrosomonas sp. Nm166 TaxID=1881054 RepID=UPI000B885573|nr:hypothetical protein [Nitrosomonas sp. Nm166]